MGITAYFYQFEKKVNSTKQPGPPIVGDFAVTVELKSVTNLFTPSLVISADRFTSGGVLTNPMKFTYCELSDFNRYYFVRSWSWVLGRWECSLEIDVLASFKTEIGNTTTYVLRSASQYDAAVIDTKYPTKADCKSISQTQSSIWHINLDSNSITDGFYVIGVVNNDSGALGAVSYYAVACTVLRQFMSQLYASPSWMNITDASISNDLQKMLINPIQYIVSCIYFPLSLPISGASWTTISTIPVGWWNITLTGGSVFYKLTGVKLQHDQSLEFTIPKHPSASGALEWLQNSPYSTYQLEFFPYGVFSVDAAKLYGFDKLRCEMKTDLITGCSTLNLIRKKSGANYNGILYTVTTQIGIPISLAQMSVDMSRLGNSSTWALSAGLGLISDTQATSELVSSARDFVSAAIPDASSAYDDYMYRLGEWYGNGKRGAKPTIGGSILTDDYKEAVKTSGSSLLSSAAKVAANIGNAVIASSGTCHMIGSTGTIAQYYFDQVFTLFYYDIATTDPTHYGYPLMQMKKINTLSGFVLCANGGDLTINATQYERQSIISLMQGGFYYE